MSVPDHLFMFRASDSNIVLFVKAPDEPTARDIASRSSCKNYTTLMRIFQDWAFIDSDGFNETVKTNMENAQTELQKWDEYKTSAQQFIDTRTGNGNTDLSSEITALQAYIDGTVNTNITTYENNLSSARSSFVVYNNDLL